MESPFPGLDPYLQKFWSNVHTSMMTYIADRLQQQLPPKLWMGIGERETIDDARHDDPTRPAEWSAAQDGSVAVAEPLAERLTQRHLEIVDTGSGARVVTVLEVLSPGDTVAVGRRSYRRKQRDYLHGGVNLVEIDLLRGGDYTVAAPRAALPSPACEGTVISVFRAAVPDFEVYPVTLRQRLPRFRVLLRLRDKDVLLDLQAVLDQCYANGRYDLRIDYAQPPDPPLAEADGAWAAALLAVK